MNLFTYETIYFIVILNLLSSNSQSSQGIFESNASYGIERLFDSLNEDLEFYRCAFPLLTVSNYGK